MENLQSDHAKEVSENIKSENDFYWTEGKFESLADRIFEVIPTGVIAVDTNFNILRINRTALEMLAVPEGKNVINSRIDMYFDTQELQDVLESGINIVNKRNHLEKSDLYVEQTILYDNSYKILLIFFKDINEFVRTEEATIEMRKETIRITDQVVNKQMRAVQEIASLLGETTAETKVALNMLKKSML